MITDTCQEESVWLVDSGRCLFNNRLPGVQGGSSGL